jgi:hypothetical protein
VLGAATVTVDTGGFTRIVVVAVLPPLAAVIIDDPRARPVTDPEEDTETALPFEVVQVNVFPLSVAPVESSAIAVNTSEDPCPTTPLGGVMTTAAIGVLEPVGFPPFPPGAVGSSPPQDTRETVMRSASARHARRAFRVLKRIDTVSEECAAAGTVFPHGNER